MNRTARTITAAAMLTAGAATLAGFTLSSSSSVALETAVTSATTEQTNAAQTYKVDLVHSNILFKIRHSGLAYFYGNFNDFTGSVEIDPGNIEDAKLNFTVEVGSVDTNNRTRDEHINSADFFNSRQYPKATFTSTGITPVSDGVYELAGDFNFHGKTRPITATLTDVTFGKQRDNDAIGFHAVFSIKRSEFNIIKYVNPQDPENGPLGDKVEIIVSVEAVSS